jgi:hypothetical protein
MKPNPKTLSLLAVASGMLASAYMIGPAPGATVGAAPAVTQRLPVTLAAAAPKPTSSIKSAQAPVPLLTVAHSEFFTAPPADAPSPEKPATTAMADPHVAAAPPTDSTAKTAIEQDGYRSVRMLVKGPDGSWRGRAMRGSSEVAVRVDADGSVAAD